MRVARGLGLALVAAVSLGAHRGDPGIELSVDLARVSLTAVDARSGEAFEAVPVVVGSPGAPTPRGSFATGRVVLHPAWTPSARARALGSRPQPPSLVTPMGVAKIPFADGGSVALHGGGHEWALGLPLSSGCVRVHDADLLQLLAWMERRGALGPARGTAEGERLRSFVRPVRVVVR